MQLLRRSDSNAMPNVRPAACVPDHRVSKKKANEGVKNVRIVTSSLGPTLYIYKRMPVLQISMSRSSSKYLVAASGQRRPAKPSGIVYHAVNDHMLY